MGKVTHGFEPVFNKNSKILIVGTMPSVESRRQSFYYGNPQNRFYDVLSTLFNCEKPVSVEQKIDMFLKNSVAVYDVLSACEINGSADSSIKNPEINDFSSIFKIASIQCVFANGKTAHKYYSRYVGEAVALPSTSPANAAWSLKRLIAEWACILNFINL